MKIAIRTYGSSSDAIDGFGGGEGRWTANLAHFLRNEGHEVIRCNEGQDSGCDMFLDASWERCQHARAPHHIHFSFAGPNMGALNPEFTSGCMASGNCNLASPYRPAYNKLIKWNKEIPHNSFFVPLPYPDDLLPTRALEIRGFDRTDIFWATKDNFHPIFCTPDRLRPDGREQVFVQNGLDTLRALIRFQEKVEFKIHFLLKHQLDQAPPRLGVPLLLDQFRHKQFYNIVHWTKLVEILAHSKLNVPVGGLWGSIPETVYAHSLPLIYPANQLSGDFGSIMPMVNETNEDDIYEALNVLWFDERIYLRQQELLNDLFKDHRTDGLRTQINLIFDQLGV